MSFETWHEEYFKTSHGIDDMDRDAYAAGAAEKTAELTALMECEHPKACRKYFSDGSPGFIHSGTYCTVCAELAAVTKERDALKREKEFALAEWSKVAKILDTLFSEAARRENADV